MDVVIQAVESVLTLFLIGSIGYILAARNWFTDNTKAVLPKLVVEISMPLYLVYVISNTITHDDMILLLPAASLPLIALLLTFAVSLMVRRMAKIPEGHKGIFSVAFTCPNTVYLGIPVNLALFGQASLPYVLLFYFVHTLFFWTIGSVLIAGDGERAKTPLFSLDRLRSIMTPPMTASLFGLLLLALDVRLPRFLLNTAEYMGSLTVPLIIISMGITLQGMNLRALRLDRELGLILFGRFFVSPLIMLAVSFLLPIPPLMRQVFVIQSSLPVITSMAAMADYYKASPQFSAVAVAVSTLLCIATIPVFMILVGFIG